MTCFPIRVRICPECGNFHFVCHRSPVRDFDESTPLPCRPCTVAFVTSPPIISWMNSMRVQRFQELFTAGLVSG